MRAGETKRVVVIDGWRDAPGGVGPHREADSCDLDPPCGYLYRVTERRT